MNKALVPFLVGAVALLALSLRPAPPFVASNVYASPSGVINIEVETPVSDTPTLALTVPVNRTVIIERVSEWITSNPYKQYPNRVWVVRAGQTAELGFERDGVLGPRVVLTAGDQLFVESRFDSTWIRFEGTWE